MKRGPEAPAPNLFIVGFPKSGTSALHRFLEQHPDVFMSRPKEPNYFCKDFHEISNRFHGGRSTAYYQFQELDEYLRLFVPAAGRKIRGEASTSYAHSAVAAAEIRSFNPDARIVVMVREPVSFLHALYSQYCNETQEPAPSLGAALDLEPARREGRSLPPRVRCPNDLYYSDRVRYADAISRFLDVFPREQVKVVVFDDFKADNRGTFREVLEFLGIDAGFEPDFELVHDSKAPRFPLLNRLLRSPALKNIPKRLLPARRYDRIQLAVQSLLMKRARRPPLRDEERRELMRRFEPEVRRLGELLGRDLLTTWGYRERRPASAAGPDAREG
jgi:hypothetical protein